MIKPNLGVVIGLPCSRQVMPEWAVALACQNWPLNTNVAYLPMRGLPVDKAREVIVEGARKLGAPYIWFVDDDVEVPLGAARQLLQTMKQADDKVAVVGGIYPNRKITPCEPMVFQSNGHGAFWKWKKDTIFEVGALLGTGCMLIRTDVFDHLEKPWFKTVDDENGKVTDDAWFCDRVLTAGFKILADAHVICTHWDNESQTPFRLAQDTYPMTEDLLPPVGKEYLLDLPTGWMKLGELLWLSEQAEKHKLIVELGSWLGRSTVAMAKSTQGQVWAIDDFKGVRDSDFYGTPDEIRVVKENQHDLLERFKANVKDIPNIHYIVADHGDYSALPVEWLRSTDERPDMVFIDGSHEYPDVKRDILAWQARLAPGGMLCGHDSDWYGVKQALDELLPGWKAQAGSIWSYQP